MKIGLQINDSTQLEFLIEDKRNTIRYLLDMYYGGSIISNIGNQNRLRKIYPKLISNII